MYDLSKEPLFDGFAAGWEKAKIEGCVGVIVIPGPVTVGTLLAQYDVIRGIEAFHWVSQRLLKGYLV